MAVSAGAKTPQELVPARSLDPWAGIVEAVSNSVQVQSGGLLVRYLRPAGGRLLLGYRLPEQCDAIIANDNPWLNRLSRNCGSPSVCRDDDLVPEPDPAAEQFRRERFDGFDLGAQIFLVIERKGNAVVVGWFARTRSAPPFEDAEVRMLAAMQPVLAATWRNDRMIRQQLLGGRFAIGVLNRLTLAVIVLDRSGTIWAANDAARHRLDAYWSAGSLRGGWRLRDAHSAARLAKAANDVISGSLDTVRTVRLSCPENGELLRFVVTPLDGRQSGTSPAGPLATAFLASPGQLAPPPPQWLREVYDLSAVEADVAARLCGGWAPGRIAEALGISIHTVRSYVKAIFFKLGVHRQAEAVARIHQDLGFLGRI